MKMLTLPLFIEDRVKGSPRQGIDPWSPACQSGVLTTRPRMSIPSSDLNIVWYIACLTIDSDRLATLFFPSDHLPISACDPNQV